MNYFAHPSQLWFLGNWLAFDTKQLVRSQYVSESVACSQATNTITQSWWANKLCRFYVKWFRWFSLALVFPWTCFFSLFVSFGFRDFGVFAEMSQNLCTATFTANANNKPCKTLPIHITILACTKYDSNVQKRASKEIWQSPMDAKTEHKSKWFTWFWMVTY